MLSLTYRADIQAPGASDATDRQSRTGRHHGLLAKATPTHPLSVGPCTTCIGTAS